MKNQSHPNVTRNKLKHSKIEKQKKKNGIVESCVYEETFENKEVVNNLNR